MTKNKDKATESYEVQHGPAFNHEVEDRYEAMGFGGAEGSCGCGNPECKGAGHDVKNTIAETAIELVRIANGSGKASEDVEAVERLILGNWKLRRLMAIGLLNGGIGATKAVHEVIQGTKSDGAPRNPLAALLGR